MTSSPYSLVGVRLVERGYCAVPAMPNKKVPGAIVAGRWVYMSDWTRRYLSHLPSDHEIDKWTSAPDGGVCLILGRASQNIVAIDIDVTEAVEPVTKALPYTPFRKTGAKGVTLFFRGAIELKAFNRRLPDGRRERLVDVLGEGRQTVLPPSIHPDTRQPYKWVGELALEDASIEEVPALPEDALDLIANALAPLGYGAEVDRPAISGSVARQDDEKSAHRLLNEHALANLDVWIPCLGLFNCRRKHGGWEAVADWRSSCTGRPLFQRKLNLSITPSGIVDFGDGPKGYSAIDLVIASGNALDADKAFVWLAEKTGWGESSIFYDFDIKDKSKKKPNSQKEDVKYITSEEILAAATIAKSQPSAPEGAYPWDDIDITTCPGLVGKIADWIVASAEFQQPLLAIGSSLALLGAVCGRQLCGPTKSGTHLYIIGVAPTGSGKDHGLKSIGRVLTAARLATLIGPGKFTSESSIVNTIIRSPTCVCAIDEFGEFLSRGKNRQASTHERAISSMMRTLWGSSFDAVPTTERAGEQFKLIYSPSFSLYGTSTIGEFYDALSDADTQNGLLNRFIILNSPKRPERTKPNMDRMEVPQEIADAVNNLYYRLGELEAEQFHGAGNTETTAPPIMVPWGDSVAESVFDKFQRYITEWMDAVPDDEKYLVRTAEMAIRIATIRAAGIDLRNPVIRKEDMTWGAALAMQSAKIMIRDAKDRIAENYWEKSVSKVILVAKKHKTFRARDVQMATRMKSKEVKEVLSDLVEMGRLAVVDITDARSDSKKTYAYEFIE